MEYNVSMLLEKIKVVAEQTRTGAVKAADRAGRKANEMAQATRLNLQIFDRNTECEVLYKEIGKLLYDIHQGAETKEDAIENKLVQLDALHSELDSLRGELAALKTVCICPHCGRQCSRDDAYCAGCGTAL
nr:hypothetical protein [uncultured Butyricicoccus sp.]